MFASMSMKADSLQQTPNWRQMKTSLKAKPSWISPPIQWHTSTNCTLVSKRICVRLRMTQKHQCQHQTCTHSTSSPNFDIPICCLTVMPCQAIFQDSPLMQSDHLQKSRRSKPQDPSLGVSTRNSLPGMNCSNQKQNNSMSFVIFRCLENLCAPSVDQKTTML